MSIPPETYDLQDEETKEALRAAGIAPRVPYEIVRKGTPKETAAEETLEELFLRRLGEAGLIWGRWALVYREYRYHPKRRWRFDFAWTERMVAVEIEGGTWSGGRHVRGAGFAKDCEKYNEAARLGWQVYRFTGDMVRSGEAIAYMSQILGSDRYADQS